MLNQAPSKTKLNHYVAPNNTVQFRETFVYRERVLENWIVFISCAVQHRVLEAATRTAVMDSLPRDGMEPFRRVSSDLREMFSVSGME